MRTFRKLYGKWGSVKNKLALILDALPTSWNFPGGILVEHSETEELGFSQVEKLF